MRFRKNIITASLIVMVMTFWGASAAAYDMAQYIPINQGDEWIFSMSMTVEGGELEGEYGPMLSKSAVNGTEVVNEVETVKLEKRTPANSKTADYVCYIFDSEGLKEYKEYNVNYTGNIAVFEEGILIMPAQLDLGEVHQQSSPFKSYDANGNLISTDTGNITNSIVAVEDVSTPAGTFQDCLKIESTQTVDSLTFRREANYWRARDVGAVKMNIADYLIDPEEGDISVNLTYELVSATVNGVSYGPCPAVFALGGDARENDLNTLRRFRDEVLSKTTEGRQIIKLYYQLGPAVVQAMANDQEFKKEIKEMIDRILPFLR